MVFHWYGYHKYDDGLMQERCNSIANALELCLSCINPSMNTMGHGQVSLKHNKTILEKNTWASIY